MIIFCMCDQHMGLQFPNLMNKIINEMDQKTNSPTTPKDEFDSPQNRHMFYNSIKCIQ